MAFNPSDASCIVAYEFEDNANDLSGNGNNATTSGTVTYADGQVNNKWAVLSGGHFLADDDDSMDLTDALTVSAWIKPDGLGGPRVVASKREVWSATGIPFELVVDGAVLSGRVIGNNPLDSPNVFTANVIYHVAMTWDGTTLKLYVDGKEVASGTRSGTITNNSADLSVGALPSGGENLSGNIDRFFLFNETKSTTDIENEYLEYFSPWVLPTSNQDRHWINPDNAHAEDGDYANSNNHLDFEWYHGFGLDSEIPDGATILGIEVRMKGNAQNSNGSNIGVRLSWNGGSSNTGSTITRAFDTGADQHRVWGSPSDTWGRSWSKSEFESNNFWVRAGQSASGNDVDIDAIWVRVTYSTPQPVDRRSSLTLLGVG